MTSSLSAKFIATVTPIFICVFVLFVGIYEWGNYEKSREELMQHLDTMAASQSIILAESIANRDAGQLSLLLASVISDPNLVGVEVHDTNGQILDSFGDVQAGDAQFRKTITVNFADGDDVRKVGTLTLRMTDRNLKKALRKHLIDHGLLATALLISGLIGAALAHRRIVGRPLGKLLSAINETRGGRRGQVDWHSNDEIGEVIESYNEMQRRLEKYERDLKAAHSQLEQSVEARTRDLVSARELAEQANRVKSKFLASMSHEFRTPMNAVLGFTQVLQMAPEIRDNPRLIDRLEKVTNSAKGLLALLDAIMNFAQIESADTGFVIEDVKPYSAIRDAIALIEPLADSRKVTFHVQEHGEEDFLLRADPLKLQAALLNLLSNAVKFNRPNGTVSVDVVPVGPRVEISICDTGYGIPEAEFENIYEPFNRLGREAGVIEGTGLGLTTTRRIIEKMDGTIDFESVEGEGTTFRISFIAAR